MKKLTAGIFAGILTIVTVNAADAAIATSGYVTEKVGAVDAKVGTLSALSTQDKTSTVAAINEVKGAVDTNETNISNLETKVNNLAGTGTGSVADQIAGVLGQGFTTENTVKKALDSKANASEVTAALDLKADKTTLEATDAKVANNTSAIETLNGDGEGSVNKKIDDAIATVNTAANTLKGRVDANESAIATLNGDGEGSVAKALANAKEYADGLDSAMNTRVTANESSIAKLDGEDTVDGSVKKQIKDAIAGVDTKLAGKQNLLNDGTTVMQDGEGNVITAVTASDGTVTVTKGMVMPAVPTTDTGETGKYVLTVTVSESGVADYMWESIER